MSWLIELLRFQTPAQPAASEAWASFTTKSFTILKEEKGYSFFKTAVGPEVCFKLMNPYGQPIHAGFRVLRQVDCILLYFNMDCYIIDLHEVFSRGGLDMSKKLQERYFRLPDCALHKYWRTHSNLISNVLVSGPNSWMKDIELHLYPIEDSKPFEPKTWLKLDFRVTGRIQDRSGHIPTCRFSVHTSRSETRIYLGSVQDNSGAEVWLALITRNKTTETFISLTQVQNIVKKPYPG